MVFEDTKLCKAHFYLDDQGYEITREQLLVAYLYDRSFGAPSLTAYMLYVGTGFVPLTVAVIAREESDAVGAFEEWCRRNDRLGEIHEDDPDSEDWGEYECHIEIIPIPRLVMEAEAGVIREDKPKN